MSCQLATKFSCSCAACCGLFACAAVSSDSYVFPVLEESVCAKRCPSVPSSRVSSVSACSSSSSSSVRSFVEAAQELRDSDRDFADEPLFVVTAEESELRDEAEEQLPEAGDEAEEEEAVDDEEEEEAQPEEDEEEEVEEEEDAEDCEAAAEEAEEEFSYRRHHRRTNRRARKQPWLAAREWDDEEGDAGFCYFEIARGDGRAQQRRNNDATHNDGIFRRRRSNGNRQRRVYMGNSRKTIYGRPWLASRAARIFEPRDEKHRLRFDLCRLRDRSRLLRMRDTVVGAAARVKTIFNKRRRAAQKRVVAA